MAPVPKSGSDIGRAESQNPLLLTTYSASYVQLPDVICGEVSIEVLEISLTVKQFKSLDSYLIEQQRLDM